MRNCGDQQLWPADLGIFGHNWNASENAAETLKAEYSSAANCGTARRWMYHSNLQSKKLQIT